MRVVNEALMLLAGKAPFSLVCCTRLLVFRNVTIGRACIIKPVQDFYQSFTCVRETIAAAMLAAIKVLFRNSMSVMKNHPQINELVTICVVKINSWLT